MFGAAVERRVWFWWHRGCGALLRYKGALPAAGPPTHHSRPNSGPISASEGPIGPTVARLTPLRAARSLNATVPCLFTQSGTDLIADINGYFPGGSSFVPVEPERLLDTRSGPGQKGYVGATPAAGQTVTLKVTATGSTNVPVTASAVVLNVTGTDATGNGFVTVWPCDQPQPTASNLNLPQAEQPPTW